MNKEFELETKTFEKSGILVEAFEVPGKIALWLEDESKGENFGTQEGDTIGLKISSKNSSKIFFTSLPVPKLQMNLEIELIIVI